MPHRKYYERWKVKQAGQGQPIIKSRPLNPASYTHFSALHTRSPNCGRGKWVTAGIYTGLQRLDMCQKKWTQRGNESNRNFSYPSPRNSFTTRIDFFFLFFFLILEWLTCFSSVFLKLLVSRRGFLLPRYTVLSTWEPGSPDEVSRHLGSRNNSTAQHCIESTSFSIRSHFMLQVAIIKHICCMKIIHCQLESKAK